MLSQSRPSPLIGKQSGVMLLGRLKAHVLALCVIGVVGVFYLSTIRAGHYWGDDFSLYIHHAKNIVEGIGYADTGYIYDPFFPEFSPKTYPPIYPLLLAPVYALFGLDLTPMKVEVIVFFLMALYAMFLVLRQELPAHYALAGVAL